MGCESAVKEESPGCRTCPNRERCHGKKPELTQEALLQLIRDTVLEVLRERRRTP